MLILRNIAIVIDILISNNNDLLQSPVLQLVLLLPLTDWSHPPTSQTKVLVYHPNAIGSFISQKPTIAIK